MHSDAETVAEYLDSLPEDRRKALKKVRAEIRKRLPKGYRELMQYGMISYVVPLSRYSETYNGQPLALASLASQKSYMAVYLNNIYSDSDLESWFTEAYVATGKRLDMGKSCVRFRKIDDLPVKLVGDAVARTPVEEFIERYEASRHARRAR